MHIIKQVKAIRFTFRTFGRGINWSIFFPPNTRRLSIFTDGAVWIIS
nr:MAG TPA: hypothetical protein [Caudoviricetes sp.]